MADLYVAKFIKTTQEATNVIVIDCIYSHPTECLNSIRRGGGSGNCYSRLDRCLLKGKERMESMKNGRPHLAVEELFHSGFFVAYRL